MAKYRPKPHQQPKWSMKTGGYIDVPNLPTKWELFLISENLEEGKLSNNSKVLTFVEKYWDKFYIPTAVLKMYGRDWEV